MQSLDPAEPISIGAMVGPDAFTEVRYLQYCKQQNALALIERLATEFQQRFGRQAGGLLRTTRPRTRIRRPAMGSINGTIKDVIDEMRADSWRSALLRYGLRPFPADALGQALARARDVMSRRPGVRRRHGGTAREQHRHCAARPRRPASDAFRDRRPRRPAGAEGFAAPAVPAGGGSALAGPALPRPQRAHRDARTAPAAARSRRAGPPAENILKQLEKERVAAVSEQTP